MVKKVVHIGIATRSIAVMAGFYGELGLEVESVEVVPEQQVRVALMRTEGASIELLEATDESSPIARFIRARGEGIHHISLEVADLRETMKRLKERNIQLIDEEPRKGADGCEIGFIHPHSTGGVLIELCELREGE